MRARWVMKKRPRRGRAYSGPKMDKGVVRVGRFEISVMVVQQETSDSGTIPIIKRISPMASISTKREIKERTSNFLPIKGEVFVALSRI